MKRRPSIVTAIEGNIQGFAGLFPIFGLIAAVAILDRWFTQLVKLPAGNFEDVVILAGFCRHLSSLTWQLLPALPIAVILLIRFRDLRLRWSDMEHGRAIQMRTRVR